MHHYQHQQQQQQQYQHHPLVQHYNTHQPTIRGTTPPRPPPGMPLKTLPLP
jgi:hypothetical protein